MVRTYSSNEKLAEEKRRKGKAKASCSADPIPHLLDSDDEEPPMNEIPGSDPNPVSSRTQRRINRLQSRSVPQSATLKPPEIKKKSKPRKSAPEPPRRSHRPALPTDPWSPPFTPFNDRFLTRQGEERYTQFVRRDLYAQRYFNSGPSGIGKIFAVIADNHLMDTVMEVSSFCKEVVLEFYSNFSGDMLDRVFVRGTMFEFTPTAINRVYGTPDVEFFPNSELDRTPKSKNQVARFLTRDGVMSWDDLTVTSLPYVISGLHQVCCQNWIPSKNNSHITEPRARLLYLIDRRIPFNFGKLIFDQIAKVAKSPGNQGILPFGNLIYNV